MQKNMFVLFFLLTVLYAVSAFSLYGKVLEEEWGAFKLKYQKQYETDYEEQLRLVIFLENRQKIAKHNQYYALGFKSFSLEINKFGDMRSGEFAKIMNGYNRTTRHNNIRDESDFGVKYIDEGITFLEPANVVLPDTVDWRKQGAVTPIKDQGQCGSCWAFSATGSLEGQHFRHNGTLISLSEQNLVDCSRRNGNDGCEGGLMNNAFNYVKVNHGIDTERSYPYEAEDESCRYNPKNNGADDEGFVNILPKGNEDKLQAAVATVGPISVAIDASQFSFQFYKSGVYYEPDCSSYELDHGVLAVGYGTDNRTSKDYWLVKNSWGSDWGEAGYIRMSRNRRNNCGIASGASYPLVK